MPTLRPRWLIAVMVSVLMMLASTAFAQDFDFGDGDGGGDSGGEGDSFDFGGDGGDDGGGEGGDGSSFDFGGGGGGDGDGNDEDCVIDESSQPYSDMQQANSFSEAKQYYRASLLFFQIQQGEDCTSKVLNSEATYGLARTLFQLGLPQSSQNNFEKILQEGPSNKFYQPTLKWLVLASRQLDGDPQVLKRIYNNYKDAYPDQVDEPLREEVAMLLGQGAYQNGSLDESIKFFNDVSPESDYYLKAKFLQGLSHVRNYKAKEAVASFNAIITYTSGIEDLSKEQFKFRELAILSTSRVYYSIGSVLYNKKERVKAVRAWKVAIKGYGVFARSSPHWLDSLFEASWTFYRVGDYDHALGLLHTLNSPFFNDRYYPEAMLLQAYIYYTNCHFDRVQYIIKEFRDTYQPMRDRLDEMLTELLAPEDVYKFLQDIYSGRVAFDATLKQVLNAALQDKVIAHTLKYIDQLEKEADTIASSDPGWAQSDLAVTLLQDLEFNKGDAEAKVGKVAKSRLKRVKDELSDLIQKALAADVETTSRYSEMIPVSEIDPLVFQEQDEKIEKLFNNDKNSDEYVYWSFDGEYWRDELGYYRYFIPERCGR